MPKEHEELPELDELQPIEELEPLDAPEAMEALVEPPPAEAEDAGPTDSPAADPAADEAPAGEVEVATAPEPAPEPAAQHAPDPAPEPAAPPAAKPAAEPVLEEINEAAAAPSAPVGDSAPSAEAAAATAKIPTLDEMKRPERQKGDKRDLERAPQLLRTASKILLAGALLPAFTVTRAGFDSWGALYLAKALALIAGWIFHQGYVATHGGKPVELIGKLVKGHPHTPAILAGVIAIGAFVPVFQATAPAMIMIGMVAEVATLLLASKTITHIFGYEHGGKFNPIFPLMFLGPGIAGLLGVFPAAQALGGDGAGLAFLGLVGTLVVGVGGCMAIYVMYVAMKQAKVEGDIKREQMRQYRKAQREAQKKARGSSGDGPKGAPGRRPPGKKGS